MVAGILLAISTVALMQFGLYYWRAMVLSVAANSVSDRIRTAAGIAAPAIAGGDFHSILMLNDLSPDLSGPNGKFRAIRAYYAAVSKVGSCVPAVAGWANRELTVCARYLAVQMDLHLERNLVCAAEMRGI